MGQGKELSEQQTNTRHRNHNTGAKKREREEEKNKKETVSSKMQKVRFEKARDKPASSFAGTKSPFLRCEPWLARVAGARLASSASIALETEAVKGQDSAMAEHLRRAAGPRQRRADSRKACHQAA